MARWLSLSLAAVLLMAAATYAADVTVSGYVQYQYTAKQTNESTPISTNFGLKAARLKGAKCWRRFLPPSRTRPRFGCA